MKWFILCFFAIAIPGCKLDRAYPPAENALDAARQFIDAFLKGDTERATYYMLRDDQNDQLLKNQHQQLSSRSYEDRQGYKESSIIIGGVEEIAEDIVIVQYKSSYDKVGRKVKVVKQDKEWLVDLKYTFNPNM